MNATELRQRIEKDWEGELTSMISSTMKSPPSEPSLQSESHFSESHFTTKDIMLPAELQKLAYDLAALAEKWQ